MWLKKKNFKYRLSRILNVADDTLAFQDGGFLARYAHGPFFSLSRSKSLARTDVPSVMFLEKNSIILEAILRSSSSVLCFLAATTCVLPTGSASSGDTISSCLIKPDTPSLAAVRMSLAIIGNTSACLHDVTMSSPCFCNVARCQSITYVTDRSGPDQLAFHVDQPLPALLMPKFPSEVPPENTLHCVLTLATHATSNHGQKIHRTYCKRILPAWVR